MPSDDRAAQVLALLAGARAAYRSALAGTLDDVTTLLAAAHATTAGHGGRAAAELGGFAAGRIDAERFAALFTAGPALDSAAEHALERARAVLADLHGRHDSLFHLRLERGADLYAEVGATLAEAGRAFGAARAAELARTGRFRAGEHAALFEPFAFRWWSRRERRLAPPLVVELDGADLVAGGLADLLDGTQKIVLLVTGAAPPAALVRAITPDVAVAQVAAVAGLEPLAAHDGAGLGAVLADADAALFVHDPAGGATLAERLHVERLPDKEPRGGVMRSSAAQRAQELRQLNALAAAAAAARAGAALAGADTAPGAATNGAAPGEQLASWLLHEAGLAEPRA